MNVQESVLTDLRSTKGVVTAELMDDEISCEVECSERAIRTQGGLEFRNEGYLEAMRRHVRICIFCTEDFEFPETPSIFYITGDGTVMGHEVMRHEMDAYLARDDLVWVSDNFIMYTERRGSGDEIFVSKAKEYPHIESYPGCTNGIIAIPAGPSDIALKSRYGVENRREIATAVMAFDII
ncbi:MAG: hypothetical protein PHX75_00460 [Candidatus Methanomethylophilaceae archaeon]|nr:hypothetical protein [Candidatus Methanomethylophilaceae archaeon]